MSLYQFLEEKEEKIAPETLLGTTHTYVEAREEKKLRSQREDFSDIVAEKEKKRKRKMDHRDGKSKKNFKF